MTNKIPNFILDNPQARKIIELKPVIGKCVDGDGFEAYYTKDSRWTFCSWGETEKEAAANLQEVAITILRVWIDRGMEIPNLNEEGK